MYKNWYEVEADLAKIDTDKLAIYWDYYPGDNPAGQEWATVYCMFLVLHTGLCQGLSLVEATIVYAQLAGKSPDSVANIKHYFSDLLSEQANETSLHRE